MIQNERGYQYNNYSTFVSTVLDKAHADALGKPLTQTTVSVIWEDAWSRSLSTSWSSFIHWFQHRSEQKRTLRTTAGWPRKLLTWTDDNHSLTYGLPQWAHGLAAPGWTYERIGSGIFSIWNGILCCNTDRDASSRRELTSRGDESKLAAGDNGKGGSISDPGVVEGMSIDSGEPPRPSTSVSVNAEYNVDVEDEDDIKVGTGRPVFRDKPAKSLALLSDLDMPLTGVLGLEPPIFSCRAWNDSSWSIAASSSIWCGVNVGDDTRTLLFSHPMPLGPHCSYSTTLVLVAIARCDIRRMISMYELSGAVSVALRSHVPGRDNGLPLMSSVVFRINSKISPGKIHKRFSLTSRISRLCRFTRSIGRLVRWFLETFRLFSPLNNPMHLGNVSNWLSERFRWIKWFWPWAKSSGKLLSWLCDISNSSNGISLRQSSGILWIRLPPNTDPTISCFILRQLFMVDGSSVMRLALTRNTDKLGMDRGSCSGKGPAILFWESISTSRLVNANNSAGKVVRRLLDKFNMRICGASKVMLEGKLAIWFLDTSSSLTLGQLFFERSSFPEEAFSDTKKDADKGRVLVILAKWYSNSLVLSLLRRNMMVEPVSLDVPSFECEVDISSSVKSRMITLPVSTSSSCVKRYLWSDCRLDRLKCRRFLSLSTLTTWRPRGARSGWSIQASMSSMSVCWDDGTVVVCDLPLATFSRLSESSLMTPVRARSNNRDGIWCRGIYGGECWSLSTFARVQIWSDNKIRWDRQKKSD